MTAMDLLALNTTSSSSSRRKRPVQMAQAWDTHDFDSQRMLQLMMGPVERPLSFSPNIGSVDQACVETLDLLGGGGGGGSGGGFCERGGAAFDLEDSLELNSDSPLPTGWEKCLDLKTGSIYYLNRSTGLSTSCDPRKARTSAVDWPASPSSSSDLTFEASSSSGHPTDQPFKDHALDLSLSLSLKPSSQSPPSLNGLSHNTQHGSSIPNHSSRSLITSQNLMLTSQCKASKQMGSLDSVLLNLNNSKTSGNFVNCISSNTVSSSPASSSSPPSAISVRDLDALRDDTRRPTSGIGHNKHEIDLRSYLAGKESSANYPMMTVGCANCLMFVMLPRSSNPKCPRCGACIECDLPQREVTCKKARHEIAWL